MGMIAIWGQSQVADIDSTNTLVTVLTALCGVELLIVGPKRPWPWIIAASLAMAAMWMCKGPAGLPIVLGVWLWPIGLLVYTLFPKRRTSVRDGSQYLLAQRRCGCRFESCGESDRK